ncbi:hypothetical protein C5S35_01695 [Candidatus Methanophagaceae archaeon]|nr:hypothetical protein C5S35_01695 [Methanophagales archaeon]
MKTDKRNLIMMLAKSIYVFIYHRINKLTQYDKVAVTMPDNRHNNKTN